LLLSRLIVVACLVELGEVIARLIVHAASSSKLEQKCVALAQSKAASLTIQSLCMARA